jgi:hypothetical protein
MMYLLDTNIWLERLLDQDRSGEVDRFLSSVPSERLFITDFSLHSIGVILGRLGRMPAFCSFIQDLFISLWYPAPHLDAATTGTVVHMISPAELLPSA